MCAQLFSWICIVIATSSWTDPYMTTPNIDEIIAVASQLRSLDRQVKEEYKTMQKSVLIEKLGEFLEIQWRLSGMCAEAGTIEALHPDVKKLISDGLNWSSYTCDSLISVFFKQQDADFWRKFEEIGWKFNAMSASIPLRENVSDLEDMEASYRIWQLGPLVVTSRLPKRFKVFFGELRMCYAYKMHNAVIALSRMTLESALKERYRRAGHMRQKEGNVVPIDLTYEHMINRLIRDGKLRNRFKTHKRYLNSVIHGQTEADDRKAAEVIKECIYLCQRCYS